MTAGPWPGVLTVGTASPVDEAIRILKRMRKERCREVRMAQLTAVEQLIRVIRENEGGIKPFPWTRGRKLG